MSIASVLSRNQRIIRAAVNPMDKSTVVSIYPHRIDEIKHTIQPGRFIIEPGSYDNPSILVVGSSSWWKNIDIDQPSIEIPVGSISVANSIVIDYCNGLLACDMGSAMPGLFYIPGEINIATIKTKYKALMDEANAKQRNWYLALVTMADALWARSAGNPMSISEDMKIAALQLNYKEKPWIKDVQMAQLVNCKACGALRNPAFPVCQVCKAVVDEAMAKELGLKFAS